MKTPQPILTVSLPALASILGAVAVLFSSGCASSRPYRGAEMTRTEVLQQDDVKDKPPTVFPRSIEETRQAACRALSFVGCNIQRQETYYVEGRRPNKMGLFVGSGGETVQVFLLPEGETRTQVWVDTDKSFVGIAGQKGWDQEVLGEMASFLNVE